MQISSHFKMPQVISFPWGDRCFEIEISERDKFQKNDIANEQLLNNIHTSGPWYNIHTSGQWYNIHTSDVEYNIHTPDVEYNIHTSQV